MGWAAIPVDLRNPGQVFSCMGFLEAAEILCGRAAGGFEWEGREQFLLEAEGAESPIQTVLAFLATARVSRLVPPGWADPPKKRSSAKKARSLVTEDETQEDVDDCQFVDVFPAKKGERMELPISLGGSNWPFAHLDHWADGSGRNKFKLYAGNRSAAKIATDMLDLFRTLWDSRRDALVASPFSELCPMGGSFNFDPRGGWTAIDAGYSPDKHKVKGASVLASPVVELMAAWGMQNARPDEHQLRQVRYAAWRSLLPPILARAAMSGVLAQIPRRRFRFPLALAGKNKVVSFAEEEITP